MVNGSAECGVLATSYQLPATSHRPPATPNSQLSTINSQLSGGTMSETVLQEYERVEAERLALARKYHHWSLVMVKVMLQEL